MSHEPSPLKYMGTQSHETVAMEAALASRAGVAMEEPSATEVDDAGSGMSAVAGTVGNAVGWAVDKGTDALGSVARQARDRATDAVGTYTRDDPIRAILVAAGAGALLMVLVRMLARSGARKVKRQFRR